MGERNEVHFQVEQRKEWGELKWNVCNASELITGEKLHVSKNFGIYPSQREGQGFIIYEGY